MDSYLPITRKTLAGGIRENNRDKKADLETGAIAVEDHTFL